MQIIKFILKGDLLRKLKQIYQMKGEDVLQLLVRQLQYVEMKGQWLVRSGSTRSPLLPCVPRHALFRTASLPAYNKKTPSPNTVFKSTEVALGAIAAFLNYRCLSVT